MAADLPEAPRRRWTIRPKRGSFAAVVSGAMLFQVMATGAAAVQGILVARALGPGDKGQVAVILLVPAVFGILLAGGVGQSAVYLIGSGRMKVSVLTRHQVSFALVSTAIAYAISAVAAITGLTGRLVPGIPAGAIALALLSVPLFFTTGYFLSVIRGLQRVVAASVLAAVQSLALLACVGVALMVHPTPTGVVVANLVAQALGLILPTVLVRRAGAAFRPAWDPLVVRTILAFALRTHLGSVLQFFALRIDVFILNSYAGVAAVGLYTVAISVGELLWQLTSSIAIAIFPRAAARSAAEMNEFTPRVMRWTLALTGTGAVGLVLVGRPLIEIVFGTAFRPAYETLVLLLPGIVLLGIGRILTQDLAGRGQPIYTSVGAGVTMLATVTLDFLLIPSHGANGAAVASSIGYSAGFVTSYAVHRAVRLRPRAGHLAGPLDLAAATAPPAD